jgi:Zn-dependent M28 family amino/carboxypeptidase
VLSHANDAVHDYLLSRLEPIVASQPYIHLSNDLISNATFVGQRTASGTSATYYEGTNILVKIDGTDAPAVESSGVLFSAHYDSVSTAPGATDDGMSIVTLLQMVQYLAHPKRRPRRTAVFLFNNGEEDGLNGARIYFEHPWSNLTKTFINLEGAAAGG